MSNTTEEYNTTGLVDNTNVSSRPIPTTTTEESDVPNWVPFAEPVPDWDEAIAKWGDWWYFHIYFIASMYFIVALFVATNIIALALSKRLPQKAYYISLNVLVLIFSVERGIFMCLDAYNIHGTLPPAVAYLFLSIGLPCMTSAFYLIFAAWFKATKMQKTYRVHKTSTLIAIITAHFLISIILDVIAGFTIHAVLLLILCQVTFIVLCVFLAGSFIYLYRRIYINTVGTRRSLSMIQERPTKAKQELYENCSYHNGNQTDSTSQISQVSVDSAESGNSGNNVVFNDSNSHLKDAQNKDDKNNSPINNGSYVSKFPVRRRLSSVPAAVVPLGARLILTCAILLLILAGLYLAGIFFCYTIQMTIDFEPEPWSFWAYEFALRLCEIALCWTISIAATGPITRKVTKHMNLQNRISRAELVNSISY